MTGWQSGVQRWEAKNTILFFFQSPPKIQTRKRDFLVRMVICYSRCSWHQPKLKTFKGRIDMIASCWHQRPFWKWFSSLLAMPIHKAVLWVSSWHSYPDKIWLDQRMEVSGASMLPLMAHATDGGTFPMSPASSTSCYAAWVGTWGRFFCHP